MFVVFFLELLQLSKSQQSSFQSQDSSPTCSLQSTDSLDQFCKDFESSFNLTSETSLNVTATLQVCDNKGRSDLGDAEINKEQGFSINDSLVLTTSADNTDQGSLNVDTSPSYEGKFRHLIYRNFFFRVFLKFIVDLSYCLWSLLPFSVSFLSHQHEQPPV